jgi:hypothetical protein
MAVQAQGQNQLIGPANNVAIIREISPDGRYVVGQTIAGVGSAGFVWDSQSGNTITALEGKGEAFGVTNERFVVGSFDDPAFVVGEDKVRSGGYSSSGTTWTSLGLGFMETPPTSTLDGTSARRVSADGKVIVGYSRKYSGGEKIYVSYSWTKNTAGQWIEEEWAHPENAEQSYIIDISADGSMAVGFIHDGETRKGILWKSKTEYELPFTENSYSEYLCISPNGVYAGFTYGGQSTGQAGIHNLETGEITLIPQGFLISDISNDGFAIGVYKSPVSNTDKAYVYSEELGFMDFGEFVSIFASDLAISGPDPLAMAFDSSTNRRYSVNAITPDGQSFAINLPADRINNYAYILKLASPVVILPYPANLSAAVSVPDRNKVLLTWEAPESSEVSDKALTGYAIYRDNVKIIETGLDTHYTDENVPVGYHSYTVEAIYGTKYSRTSNAAQVAIVDTYELPFHEDFSSLSFTTNYWTADLEYGGSTRVGWVAYTDAGVESRPGLGFSAKNFYGIENKQYAASFISKYLDGRNTEKVYLSFLVKPRYYLLEQELTPDTLFVDVYNGEEWKTLDKSYFKLVSEWKAEMLDLSSVAAGKFFQVRFRITGANYTVSEKFIFFDDITVSTTLPAGNAAPQTIRYKEETDDKIQLVWQQNTDSEMYGLTYANSSRKLAVGNNGKPFIAVNSFDAEDLAVYNDLYLTSVTAFVSKKYAASSVPTLKLAVFEDDIRIVDQAIANVTANTWNTFRLETPVLLKDKNLKFGIEVIEHADNELPIGIDDYHTSVTGKGDLYSETGGTTWQTLAEANLIGNWCIIGNVSTEGYAGTRDLNIVGYNVYKDGVRVNEDLIFGQSFVTDNDEGCFTVRAYSLADGISDASEEECITKTSLITPEIAQLSVYPNPTTGEIQIKGESKIGSIQVFDVIGKLRKEINVNDTETTVNLSAFPNGIYFLKMDGETIKVIKQ